MSFENAVAFVRSLPKDGPVQIPTDKKLVYYGLFKQATEGDNNGAQPWAIQLEARAKWDAWTSRKGMTSDEAKVMYVQTLTDGCAEGGVDWTKGYEGYQPS